MNIRQALLTEDNNIVRHQIVTYIERNPTVFEELMQCFFDTDYRMNQKATWSLGKLVENNPTLIEPYLEQMIDKLEDQEILVGLKRNIYRTLQWATVPEKLEGKMLDMSFKDLMSRSEPVAVRVFAMTVAFNIAIKYPELAAELKQVLATDLPHGSAGYKARAKKLIKAIDSKSIAS